METNRVSQQQLWLAVVWVSHLEIDSPDLAGLPTWPVQSGDKYYPLSPAWELTVSKRNNCRFRSSECAVICHTAIDNWKRGQQRCWHPHEWKQTGSRKEEFSWGDSWEVELGFSKMKDGVIILMINKKEALMSVNDLLLEKRKQIQRYLL